MKTANDVIIYVLRNVGIGGELVVAVSTRRQMILRKARELVRGFPAREREIARSMPFTQGFSDEELREKVKTEGTKYECWISLYDNRTGEFLDSVEVKLETRTRF